MTLDLLSWRAAPTTSGPRSAASDGEGAKATSRECWDAWMAAHPDKVPEVLAEARRRVRAAVEEGRKPRIGSKALAEFIRAFWCVPFNNSATAGLGEWLSEHEDLRPFVERRGKATP